MAETKSIETVPKMERAELPKFDQPIKRAAEPEPKDEVKEARGEVKAARQGKKARRLRARAKRIEERPTVYEKLQQMKAERGGTGNGMTIPPKELAALEHGLVEDLPALRRPRPEELVERVEQDIPSQLAEARPMRSREEMVQEALERISAYEERFTQRPQKAKPADEPTEASD